MILGREADITLPHSAYFFHIMIILVLNNKEFWLLSIHKQSVTINDTSLEKKDSILKRTKRLINFFIFRVPRRWHLLFPCPWKKVGSGIRHFFLHKYVHVTSQTYIVVFSVNTIRFVIALISRNHYSSFVNLSILPNTWFGFF